MYRVIRFAYALNQDTQKEIEEHLQDNWEPFATTCSPAGIQFLWLRKEMPNQKAGSGVTTGDALGYVEGKQDAKGG